MNNAILEVVSLPIIFTIGILGYFYFVYLVFKGYKWVFVKLFPSLAKPGLISEIRAALHEYVKRCRLENEERKAKLSQRVDEQIR